MESGFGGGLVAKRASLELSEDAEAVDCPLLKLLELDIGSGRVRVKIEAVRILRVIVSHFCELFLAMVDDNSPLGLNSVERDHVCDCLPSIVLKLGNGNQSLDALSTRDALGRFDASGPLNTSRPSHGGVFLGHSDHMTLHVKPLQVPLRQGLGLTVGHALCLASLASQPETNHNLPRQITVLFRWAALPANIVPRHI